MVSISVQMDGGTGQIKGETNFHALRKIICIEDELLRKKSRPVEKFDEKLHRLLDDMAETMYNANGVGLAAPQVAVLRRVVVMDWRRRPDRNGQSPKFWKPRASRMGRKAAFPCRAAAHGQAPDEGARQIPGPHGEW